MEEEEEENRMEENPENIYEDEDSHLPFARGGPIYAPHLVGPLTSVYEFKSSVLYELNELEAELVWEGDFDRELSVDELRVFTEEELVESALREVEDDLAVDAGSQQFECTDEEAADASCVSGKEIVPSGNSAINSNNIGVSPSLNSCTTMTCDTDVSIKKIKKKKKSNKRGRVHDRNSRAVDLEGSYLSKVKQLAELKQKQDEDKLAARLHSFSGNLKSGEGTISVPEKTERTRSLRFITSHVKVKRSKSREHVPLCYPEIVLCVEIYDRKNASRKTQEFLVLGSQFLSDLRDNIYCLTDKLMQTAGEHDPSGYILVEDTFCNDLRSPSAIDYSKPIFNWLENHKNDAIEKWEFIMSGELKKKQKEWLGDVDVLSLPNFRAVDMHRTRFSDLRFRLGAGYLYCHQGDCKHNIVIRDMRLIHQEDVQNQADYPLLTFQPRPFRMKCSVCNIYHATKMTVDDKWAPKNPCYFCIKCYYLLHYKEDNSLLYPHSVFDYYHE